MRISLALVVIGCGAQPDARPRTQPIANAAAGSSFCLPSDQQLDRFWVDASSARFCTRELSFDGSAHPTNLCAAVDFETGAIRRTPIVPEPNRSGFDVKQDPTGVQICKSTACTKLELDPPSADPNAFDEYFIEFSDDNKLVLAHGPRSKGKVALLDASTGKRRQLLTAGDGSYTCSTHAAFLGETIYVALGNCSGWDAAGFLLTRAGTQIARIGGENTVLSGKPVRIAAERYAFYDYNETQNIEIVDVRTGKAVRSIPVKAIACEAASCGPFGDHKTWAATPVAVTPSGKLVTIGNAAVTMFDPATGVQEKSWRLPRCAQPPESK